ncbi:Heterokaryon incompatibility protein 6, OR allele [Colletotrichum tropicale]|nr:Heterokaryon incompatibility protein 6, OR allele [Colletotrichum tropicale]
MGFIYLRCAAITVWLGSECKNSEIAIDEMINLAAKAPYAAMPELAPRAIAAIQDLLSKPWWERVWIVQEICWGGGASKMWEFDSVTLRCGQSSIRWGLLVMACARIKVDESEHRQTIAGVDKVLRLDYVRWSAGRLGAKMRESKFDATETLQLVGEYRHFNATDPRDKIFGILGLTFSHFTDALPGFKIDYNVPVQNIYLAFATVLIGSSAGLEVLRHCTGVSNRQGFGGHILPSWVPDWSHKRCDAPLPSRTAKTRGDIPWWAVSEVTQTKKNTLSLDFPESYESAEIEAQKVLERGKIKSDPREFARYFPREIVDQMQSLVDEKRAVFAGIHDEHYIDPKANLGMYEIAEHVNKANQKLIQHTIVRGWLDEDMKKRPAHAASGDSKGNFFVDAAKSAVDVEGIFWDKIVLIQEPFPADLYSSWESSTVFMVAIGQCKHAALNHQRASPYPSTEELHAAFWDTLVAGQEYHSVTDFEGCLPEVPKDWTTGEPPVTFQNPRIAELTERRDIFKSRSTEFGEIASHSNLAPVFSFNLPPLVSSNEELQELRTKFQRLAEMWSLQPYDLYHRPFSLPSTVPDPYWQSRCQFDQKALKETAQSRRHRWEHSLLSPDRDETSRLQKLAFQAYGESPSVVPQLEDRDADFRLEKYALGRRFFITEKGYMGLAPVGAQTGDIIVVLFGSHVPFILRGREAGDYEVVGETYVSGIMKGEVLNDLNEGKCEANRFMLV